MYKNPLFRSGEENEKVIRNPVHTRIRFTARS